MNIFTSVIGKTNPMLNNQDFIIHHHRQSCYSVGSNSLCACLAVTRFLVSGNNVMWRYGTVHHYVFCFLWEGIKERELASMSLFSSLILRSNCITETMIQLEKKRKLIICWINSLISTLFWKKMSTLVI